MINCCEISNCTSPQEVKFAVKMFLSSVSTGLGTNIARLFKKFYGKPIIGVPRSGLQIGNIVREYTSNQKYWFNY